jgi:hypothetical protein
MRNRLGLLGAGVLLLISGCWIHTVDREQLDQEILRDQEVNPWGLLW